jgi:hypothetical protein
MLRAAAPYRASGFVLWHFFDPRRTFTETNGDHPHIAFATQCPSAIFVSRRGAVLMAVL